jgi:hypothetical protein
MIAGSEKVRMKGLAPKCIATSHPASKSYVLDITHSCLIDLAFPLHVTLHITHYMGHTQSCVDTR